MNHIPSSATDCDIAICGAGPVGMALAALLVKRGVAASRITLIDAMTLAQASTDPRSVALSWGSRQILEDIGAWPFEATAIHQIHVSRRGQFGRSMIEREQHKVPALGYVTRYGEVVRALGAVCERAGIVTLRPARVAAVDELENAVVLTLNDAAAGTARSLRAAIVVQAEGGLFGDQVSRAQRRDYRQTAIIAQVRSSRPIPHRAFERFTEQGPLALLPQGDEYSLVWCVRPDAAEALLALDERAFLVRLGEAFGDRVGRFTHASPRLSFALVVIDPDLRDGDGGSLLHNLHHHQVDARVLLYSARHPERHMAGSAFLPKPWTSPRQLWRTVSDLLAIGQTMPVEPQ